MIPSMSRTYRQLWANKGLHLPMDRQQWRQLPGDIASGWWLLVAEVLAVVILIILAAVAGPVATAMSDDLDTWALASLASSDPMAACINTSTAATTTGWYLSNISPVLASGLWARNDTYASQLRQQGFTVLDSGRVRHDMSYDPEDDLIDVFTYGWPWGYEQRLFWNFTFPTPAGQAPNERNDTSYRMLREVLGAMWQCNIITGAYCDLDLPSYISRDCQNCNPSLRVPPPGVQWTKEGILSARDTVYGIVDCLFSNSVGKDELNIGYSFKGGADFFLSDSEWGTHDRPYVEDDICCGGFILPAGILRIPGVSPPWASRVLWLGFGQQTQGTAACLANQAPMLRTHLAGGRHRLDLSSPKRTSGPGSVEVDIVPSNNSGLEVREIWLQMLDGARGPCKQYSCADGVDVTSPVAVAALLKRQAYRDAIKSKLYNVTLFGSMKNLSYDDVYAVYTAILGALFGAFALLVTTLFVFVLAILKRMAVTHMVLKAERDDGA